VAGCGGDDNSGTAATEASQANSQSPPQLTKAELIDHADEICDESWEEMLDDYSAYRSGWVATGTSEKRMFSRAVGDVFLPSILFWYDHINFLGPPKEAAGQTRRMLHTLEQTAVRGLDRPYSFDSPAELAALYRRSNRMMRQYGIKRCVVTSGSFPS